MSTVGNIPVYRTKLSDGDAGVDETVRHMVDMAAGQYGAKSPKIRALAIDIVRNAGVNQKDYYGEIVAVFNYVRDNIRYVKDPVGQETLSYPEETAFNSRAGDCDDKVILTMALLGAIGIRSYPVVVGTHPKVYSHVYLYAVVPQGSPRRAGQTIPLDPIMPWPAGKEAKPPHIRIKKEYPEYAQGVQMVNGLGGEFGDYVEAPSYLDTEHSHAAELLSEGSGGGTNRQTASSVIGKDRIVNNSAKVIQSQQGADAMFTGKPLVVPPTGASVTAREDEYGRIWNGAAQEVPASAKRVGPLGPLIQRRASETEETLSHTKAYELPTATEEGRASVRVPRATPSQKKIVSIRAQPTEARRGGVTIEAESDEIEGLALYLGDLYSSAQLAGLGNNAEGEEATEEAATVGWWARVKAWMARNRAAGAQQQATAAARGGNRALASHLQQIANDAQALATKAQRLVEMANKVESAAATTPERRIAAKSMHQALDEEAKEAGVGTMAYALPHRSQSRLHNLRHRGAAVASHVQNLRGRGRRRINKRQARNFQGDKLMYPGAVTGIRPHPGQRPVIGTVGPTADIPINRQRITRVPGSLEGLGQMVTTPVLVTGGILAALFFANRTRRRRR